MPSSTRHTLGLVRNHDDPEGQRRHQDQHMRWVDDYQRRSLEWIDLGIDYGGHDINATGISIDLREWPHFVEAVKLLDMILKTKGAVIDGTS